jgi:predicted nucleotidyltransferase
MDKKTVIDIVERFTEELRARGIRPEQVILYGSQATGSATEASDIDVLVVSEGFAGKSYWERVEVLADAIYAVYAPVEAVAMTPEEWRRGDSMIADFARQGEVLYAA